MNVIFYQLDKKHNSTKQPSGTGTTLDCKLKDSCSVIYPSLTLNMGSTTAPAYNYCYISDFSRYYFVNNWTYFQGLWTADLEVDTLGTYKTSIGNSSQYILRSASSYDGKVPDTLYPSIYQSASTVVELDDASSVTVKNQSYSIPATVAVNRIWGDDALSNGYVVLNTVSDDKSSAGGTNGGTLFYLMPYLTFKSFAQYLVDAVPSGWPSATNLIEMIAKRLYNPIQYTLHAYWLPCLIPGITLNEDYYIQTGDLFFNGGNVSLPFDPRTNVFQITFSMDLPSHPLESTRGLYMDAKPWTEYSLSIQPFGYIQLNSTDFMGYTKVYFRIVVDPGTGNADLFIYPMQGSTYGACSYHTTAMFGATLSLTEATVDIIGGISSALQPMIDAGVGYLSGGKNLIPRNESQALAKKRVMGALEGASETGNYVGSMINSMSPHATTNGVNGAFSAFSQYGKPTLYARFYYPTDENLSHKGRPLCTTKTINTLSGYVLCQDGDVDLNCTQEEKNIVENFLTNGFFYE